MQFMYVRSKVSRCHMFSLSLTLGRLCHWICVCVWGIWALDMRNSEIYTGQQSSGKRKTHLSWARSSCCTKSNRNICTYTYCATGSVSQYIYVAMLLNICSTPFDTWHSWLIGSLCLINCLPANVRRCETRGPNIEEVWLCCTHPHAWIYHSHGINTSFVPHIPAFVSSSLWVAHTFADNRFEKHIQYLQLIFN